MEQYLITGGAKLKGEIKTAGAKNQALKVISASILSKQPMTITNCPQIEDVNRLLEILVDIGVKVKKENDKIEIDPSEINKTHPKDELVKKLRSSIMLVGPLLARFGKVTMSHPGGCIIGQRPIDMFLSGFKLLGAEILETKDGYTLTAKKLTGAKIVMPWVSVTGTESLMMTACLAKGTTEIINAAMEPEISALADYLNNCGAKITGAGTPVITIEGVDELTGGKCELIPDRIEAGTFIVLGLLTKSKIKITNCEPKHLEVVITLLKKAGANLEIGKDYIITLPSKINSVELRTHEYPGFPTDLQAPFTALMTQATGISLIHEMIYEGRLFYTDKLNNMGAKIIMCDPHRVLVNGPTQLYGRRLESPDLRAGITLVLAGLIAKGETIIDNIYQIERGYEKIVERLNKLGAKIKKI